MSSRAIFLDRDGTINEEVGYLDNLNLVRLIDGAGKAIKSLNDAGFKIVVVTNQSGVARGYFTEDFVIETNNYIQNLLVKDGAKVDAFYFCPHHVKGLLERYAVECKCRKPSTGMLEKAAKDLDLNISNSIMIGDKITDVQLAKNGGLTSILLLTGFGEDELVKIKENGGPEPDHIFKSIFEAAEFICSTKS